MKIVGYTDRLSVQPGENIRFMVSCGHETYRADIVRLIHGDDNPLGPGFKEEPVGTSVDGQYSGRKQTINAGSYTVVPDHEALRLIGSFTLQAWIYPTLPQNGIQGILTKWSAWEGRGYGLFVDEVGALAVWTGNQKGRSNRCSTRTPLRAAQWYFVAAVYDAQNLKLSLYQEPVSMWPRDDSRAVVESDARESATEVSDVPFLMAGFWDREESGKAIVRGHFNGKIDSPRLFDRALTRDEIQSLRQGADPALLAEGIVAQWDLGRDFSSPTVTDVSSNGLHGYTMNMPARGVTGHNFTGAEINFNRRPHEFAAIYFHDDDLEDAGWEVDFLLEIPGSMRSGVYAARLTAEDGDGTEDYVPFFVRAKKGTSSNPILFLVPTASYLAYGNAHLVGPEVRARLLSVLGKEIVFPAQVQDEYIINEGLLGLYDRHSDGSGVFYSSRLRPIVSMRPKYNWPRTVTVDGVGAHPHQFNADLHLLDWMEAKGYQFDVATDEDLNFEGVDVLDPYCVVVTGTHPEYWSDKMLDAMEAYLAKGGRLMYLGGNGFYWVTSFDPVRPHLIEVRRWHGTGGYEAEPGEYYHSTTNELGGLWRFRNRPPQSLVGVGITANGLDQSQPYQRQADSFDPRAAFIFEGVPNDEEIGHFGLVMGGAAGFEIDRADSALGTPPHALLLATATGFSDDYLHVVEELLATDLEQGGTVNPLVKSDMVYFEGPEGGAVFSVGSIAWCGALSHNNYDNNVSRITENVLRRFTSGGTE